MFNSLELVDLLRSKNRQSSTAKFNAAHSEYELEAIFRSANGFVISEHLFRAILSTMRLLTSSRCPRTSDQWNYASIEENIDLFTLLTLSSMVPMFAVQKGETKDFHVDIFMADAKVCADHCHQRLRIHTLAHIRRFFSLERKRAMANHDELLSLHMEGIRKDRIKQRRWDSVGVVNVRLSLETALDEDELCQLMQSVSKRSQSEEKMYRLKSRHSFWTLSGGCRIDLSVVKSGRGTTMMQSGILTDDWVSRRASFEIEVELVDISVPCAHEEFEQILRCLYCACLRIPDICTETTSSHIRILYASTIASGFLGPNMRSFTRRHCDLLCKDCPWTNPSMFATTFKSDGTRCLGLIVENGFFLLTPRMEIISTGMVSHWSCKGRTVVMDGELLKGHSSAAFHFQVFDLYVDSLYGGVSGEKCVFHLTLKERLHCAQQIVSEFTSSVSFKSTMVFKEDLRFHVHVSVKPFFFNDPVTTLDDCVVAALHHPTMMPCDGVIFMPVCALVSGDCPFSLVSDVDQWRTAKSPLTWNNVLKWKPLHLLSIDFCVQLVETSLDNDHQIQVVLYTTHDEYTLQHLIAEIEHEGLKSFDSRASQTTITTHNFLLSLICTENRAIIKSDDIVELVLQKSFRLDNGEFHASWLPLRLRRDKRFPNKESVARENFELSVDAIRQEDLQLSAMKHYSSDQKSNVLYSDISCYKTTDHQKHFSRPLRTAHQQVKQSWTESIAQELLSSFDSDTLRIVDLACGRFADIHSLTSPSSILSNALELYVGIDLSLTELIDVHNGAYKRQAGLFRKQVKNAQKCLFLQGDCSKRMSASGECCEPNSVYVPIYQWLYTSSSSALPEEEDHPSCSEKNMVPSTLLSKRPSWLSSCFFDRFRSAAVKKFHLCTIHFALHYFCGNSRHLTTLAENVATLMLPSGKLIGICFEKTLVLNTLFNEPSTSAVVLPSSTFSLERSPGLMRLIHTSSVDNVSVVVCELQCIQKDLESVARSKAESSHVRVYMESIGQSIVEPLVDFDLVSAVFAENGLHAVQPSFRTVDYHNKEVRIDFENIIRDFYTKKTNYEELLFPFSFCNTMFQYEYRSTRKNEEPSSD